MSNRSAAIRAYSALLTMTISPFRRRSTCTVLSSSALRKPNSIKIRSTANATPDTAMKSRRRSCVRFFQARGVREDMREGRGGGKRGERRKWLEQFGRIGAVGFANGGQAGGDAQGGR